MRILITGAYGQLGKTLHDKISEGRLDGHDVMLADINGTFNTLDITDRDDVEHMIKEHNIDTVINCAAYTDVEKAEDEEYTAYSVNCLGVKNLAEVLKSTGGRLIHISTDYVYDGQRSTPYKENMLTLPLNAYGRTKLEGERAIEETGVDHVILRTSWLYSKYGKNFVKTMLGRLQSNEPVTIVSDQIGSPTYAPDLADMIIDIVNDREVHGVLHCSNEGCCSWYDLTMAIKIMIGSESNVRPCNSAYINMKAKRPSYSVMDKTGLLMATNKTMPHWMESLKTFINNDL